MSRVYRRGAGPRRRLCQLGHDARLTLSTYGHVMDEFEDMPLSSRKLVAYLGLDPKVRLSGERITRTSGPR